MEGHRDRSAEKSKRKGFRFATIAAAGALVTSMLLTGHESKESAVKVEPQEQTDNNEAIHMAQAIPNTTEHQTTTSSTSTTIETTTTTPPTTTEQPTTTTTLPPPPQYSWSESVYQDNGCNEGNRIRVNVMGEDEGKVPTQVSADYMQYGRKVGTDGLPIPPFEGYSEHYLINPQHPPEGLVDGATEVCFENIPNDSSVFLEFYPKVNYLNQMLGINPRYAGTMISNLWPTQDVQARLPLICRPEEGVQGSTGRVITSATINGQPATVTRNVAWSTDSNLGPGRIRGFGALDASQSDAQAVPEIDLAGNQKYLFQIHAIDANGNEYISATKNLMVEQCRDHYVNFEQNSTGCFVTGRVAELEIHGTCSTDAYVG